MPIIAHFCLFVKSQSQRVKGLGGYLCKSRVCDVVQVAAEKIPGLKRQEAFAEIRTPAMGGDVTS
jgi:hypothetical protein